ncbi:MAG: winged helix-turn-helix transcriptional regulator [Candidatus Thorarchaeota archaeon]|nr:winged helix-turn-helix transcriptional regulator [Candidatus Thorarchaeota archaeon]
MTVALDKTDVDILNVLSENDKGAKISTKDLAEILKISDRTVRYRLNRLKEKGLLKKSMVRTYERKIGVADMIIAVESNPKNHALLANVIDALPPLYYYGPTYGKYNGYWIFAQYPLATPQLCKRLFDEMKDLHLIEDYHLMEAIDYTTKVAKISAFLPDSNWEWSTWYSDIDRTMRTGKETDMGFQEFPNQENFDYKDLQIVKKLVDDAEITLKDLGDVLDLSQPQVHKRVKRLEEIGVIAGYKPYFTLFEDKDGISITCVYKSRKHAKKILYAFGELPFSLNLSMQGTNQYTVIVYLPTSEITSYLQGLNMIREHVDSLFVQFTLHGKSKGYAHLFDTFNMETNSWDMPVQEYLDTIKKMAPK